jgi:hypothetical protein
MRRAQDTFEQQLHQALVNYTSQLCAPMLTTIQQLAGTQTKLITQLGNVKNIIRQSPLGF